MTIFLTLLRFQELLDTSSNIPLSIEFVTLNIEYSGSLGFLLNSSVFRPLFDFAQILCSKFFSDLNVFYSKQASKSQFWIYFSGLGDL